MILQAVSMTSLLVKSDGNSRGEGIMERKIGLLREKGAQKM